jgi:pyruvate dehydrogenase E1 component beta subunit
MFSSRKISYSLAINEALGQKMLQDWSVFLIGQGVKSAWYVGNTCRGLLEKFGPERVIDTPISENAVTGAAVGAAIAGMRPVVVHPRMDFMIYALDPIINEAANWYYMFGGECSVPVVIWAVINRGGEQGAQHSQALQALFSHIPGLKVVMPATPYDAKGLLISSIEDENPVVFIDDRWLYNIEGEVPEKIYRVPIGKGVIRKKGKDITIAATSYMMWQALEAAKILEKEKIDLEVIDLRSIYPLDENLLLESVKKTGRFLIADAAWKTGGVAAEISALVSQEAFTFLKAPVARVTLPDTPAPVSHTLEKAYYPTKENIIQSVRKLLINN